MTKEQFDSILEASKPTPVMYLSGGTPMYDSPQENANRAWREIAKELGADFDSIEPPKYGEPQTVFYANEKAMGDAQGKDGNGNS